jgi:hypothetical protein
MMKVHVILIAASIVVFAGCGGEITPVDTDDPGQAQAPRAPSGWNIADGPTQFTSESLFEYLNGGAPLYLDFGFEGLTQTRYQMGDDPFASVTLDIYDMGSELGAFGVYRTIRPVEVEVENWGVEGYRSGTIAATWRGAIYVQGEADDDRPELVEGLEWLVASAIEGVEGPQSLPSEIEALPTGGRVPGSERYVAADLFGHAFLPGGVVARYVNDEEVAELFYTELPGALEAEEALDRLRTYEQEWGAVEAEITNLGDGGFRFTDPGLGAGMVVRKDIYVVGAHGSANADGYVRELLESLARK